MTTHHIPVLLEEIVEYLNPHKDAHLVDGTVGAGGHSEVLLKMGSRVLGLDRDPEALRLAQTRLKKYGSRVRLVHASYETAPKVLANIDWVAADGILLDLGLSSMQLDQADRGFSFRLGGPLDLRFDPTIGQSAAEWIAHVNERDLADVLYRYGELFSSRSLARKIVAARKTQAIATTEDLLVASGLKHPRHGAQLFQAIRIATNDELGNLTRALPRLWEILAPGGRLAVISFHSLEDRLVKHAFRDWSLAGDGKILTKKPVIASDQESTENPRARSAKLRVIEKSK